MIELLQNILGKVVIFIEILVSTNYLEAILDDIRVSSCDISHLDFLFLQIKVLLNFQILLARNWTQCTDVESIDKTFGDLDHRITLQFCEQSLDKIGCKDQLGNFKIHLGRCIVFHTPHQHT